MIKVDSKERKIRISKSSRENYTDFCILVGCLCDIENEEEIKRWFKIALECYEEEGSVLQEKHKATPEKYEINAKNKREVIEQVKALELPKYVEKVVIEQLMN